jgi:MFS-type transporter involved in bile tolerance (Atg22 family)
MQNGSRREIITVYAAGLIQGVALVTFPAASAVFTNPKEYGLSSTEYGGMFVPQAIMAVVSSLLGSGLRSRLGTKRIYLLGLFSNLLAMGLLVVSSFVMREHAMAYRHIAFRHDLHGYWFWIYGAGTQYVCRGFFSEKGG